MISIALCITDLNFGGAEQCLVTLATRIDRNRFHGRPIVEVGQVCYNRRCSPRRGFGHLLR